MSRVSIVNQLCPIESLAKFCKSYWMFHLDGMVDGLPCTVLPQNVCLWRVLFSGVLRIVFH